VTAVELSQKQIDLLRKLGLPERLTTDMDDDQWRDIMERLLDEVQMHGFNEEFTGENDYGLLCSSVYMAMIDAEEKATRRTEDQIDSALLRKLKADCLDMGIPPYQFCCVLAASDNYIVYSEFDYAYLFFKNDDRDDVFLGWYYGDPNGALIDRAERFCTVFSNGALVYMLEEPFASYDPRVGEVKQWAEFDRTDAEWASTHCNEVRFVEGCEQLDDGSLEYRVSGGGIVSFNVGTGFSELQSRAI